MAPRGTLAQMLCASLALMLGASIVAPAIAAPTREKVNSDRSILERALLSYDEARSEADALESKVAETFAQLDSLTAQEAEAEKTLRARVVSAYRAPESDLVFVLIGATSFQDFVTRWELLTRIVRKESEALKSLREARRQAEATAGGLIEMQEQQARALDALAAEVAIAREALADSESALREYEAAVAAADTGAPAAQPTPSQPDSTQQRTGSGAWQTAVASHYGRNFSGRGASGAAIGPYSMMVAHLTLPFGTLVEFEYNGKRAVASVEDRGPHVPGRTWDLGPGVVRALGFSGVHEVRYRVIK